jgi:hypothetical protein
MIILDHEGEFTKLDTGEAWCYLEINCGIIKDDRGRAEWKDPTPTGNRMIAMACTKTNGETFDGSITVGGKKVAVFRFGKFEEE